MTSLAHKFALFLGLYTTHKSSVSVSAFAPASRVTKPSQLNYIHEAETNDVGGLIVKAPLTKSIDDRSYRIDEPVNPNLSASTTLGVASLRENHNRASTRFMSALGSCWGSFGVIYILAKGISRVLPIALEPLSATSSLALSPVQWSLYALSCLFFAYAEGYKGFHKKFAPLVVKRSFTLVTDARQRTNPFNLILAPLYSMGLWGATSKRMKISWGVSLGVSAMVAMVKRLPPVPRCILDAGVVVGLTIGSASILYHMLNSLRTGELPAVDACLPYAPEKKSN